MAVERRSNLNRIESNRIVVTTALGISLLRLVDVGSGRTQRQKHLRHGLLVVLSFATDDGSTAFRRQRLFRRLHFDFARKTSVGARLVGADEDEDPRGAALEMSAVLPAADVTAHCRLDLNKAAFRLHHHETCTKKNGNSSNNRFCK